MVEITLRGQGIKTKGETKTEALREMAKQMFGDDYNPTMDLHTTPHNRIGDKLFTATLVSGHTVKGEVIIDLDA